MKRIKAIFTDIDKTITPKHDWMHVSSTDIKTLKRTQKDGIHTILSTGRCEYFTKPIHKKINVNDKSKYIIVSSGGAIINTETDEIVFEKKIDPKVANKIVEYIKDKGLLFFTPGTPKYFVDPKNWKKFSWLREIYGNWWAQAHINEYDVKKHSTRKMEIVVSKDAKETEKVKKELSKMFPSLKILRTSNMLVEINQKGITKGSAIKWLTKQEGWDLKCCVGIGDSPNDLDMLKTVGIPIAMGNSFKEIEEVGLFKTLPVEESGFSHAIKMVESNFENISAVLWSEDKKKSKKKAVKK